ncbi:helix-turn-helix domain-containing protein [Roseomonas sp. OT10]|uniref:helix-turn-helix domain-containing protein n=1 Tax=Roseomonas cutis TaxID=2897332 RepID=UPI001E49DFA1|nr:helix-turn-helix transcriptional regulator [Roseomonas sp. OT10]UFN51515.1 helix-turn-helix domain-containing protein [Roseomonas sp. OT10]
MLPAQTRAARGLVDWSQGRLAEAAGVSLSTVKDFEAGRRQPVPATLSAIRAALEAAGVEFIAENGGGAGVRLRKTS